MSTGRRPSSGAGRALRGLPLLLGLVLLAACDGAAPAPPARRTLELTLVEGAAPRGAVSVVERLDPADEIARWTIDAPQAEPLDVGADAPVLGVGSATKERRISLRREGRLDPSRFDTLRAVVWFRGRGGLAVDFVRDERVVGTSGPVAFTIFEQLTSVDLEVPPEVAAGGPLDALVLRCVGPRRQLGLVELVLLERPLATRVPDPAEGAALIEVGAEARRGWAVAPGRPLTGAVPAVPGAALRLAFARAAGEPRAGAELLLRIEGGGLVFEDGLALDAAAWRPIELELPDLPAGGATLSVEVTGAGVAAAVADLRLVAPEPDPPTVLLITSDTHRGDHLGVAGRGVDVQTPFVDALAARGVLFTDCFAPTNNTNPSHVALMTATHPRDTGVLNNYTPLAEGAPTLAEVFARAGWATAATVATRHLGHPGSGLGQGFSRMAWPRAGQRGSDGVLDDVRRWLPELEGEPLFLWVHVFDAHTPYEPPDDVLARYWDPARDPTAALPGVEPLPERALPRELRGTVDLDHPRALYKAEVTHVDAQLERLLDDPRLGRGVVALTADHGEGHGERGVWFWHLGLYTSTLHVPLVLAGPGVPAGQVSHEPVSALDLGRTLLDLAGLGGAPFPGRDLLARLDGAGRSPPRFAVEGYGMSASVTLDGLHLVLHLTERDLPNQLETRALHEVELYDLTTDPACATNLVDLRPADARRLREGLVRWLSDAERRGWTGARTEDAERIAELQQLGYVAPAAETASDALWVPDACDWCRRFED